MVEHRAAGGTWWKIIGALVVLVALSSVKAESTAADAGSRIEGTPPTATLTSAPNVVAPAASYAFSVTYKDGFQVNAASLSSSNVRVSGPNGFSVLATFNGSVPNVNAASIVASYSFTPPGGVWSFATNGTYTLAVQASQVKGVSGLFVAAATLGTFTVSLPNPLTFASAPTANPNPAVPNVSVAFAASAVGTEPLTYVWNFGDGAMGDGSTPSHVYSAVGAYAATVTVADATGLTATANITVVVLDPEGDEDRDGYTNNVEVNLGSNPNSSLSAPFRQVAIATPVMPFTLQKTNVTLTFTQVNEDQILVTGTLPLPTDFNPSKKFVCVEVGHVVRGFQLDASGNAITSLAPSMLAFSANDSFHLKPGTNTRRFKLTIGFGDFQTLFATQADPQAVLANTPGAGQTKKVRVTIYINNTAFQMTATRRYRVVRGVGKFGY